MAPACAVTVVPSSTLQSKSSGSDWGWELASFHTTTCPSHAPVTPEKATTGKASTVTVSSWVSEHWSAPAPLVTVTPTVCTPKVEVRSGPRLPPTTGRGLAFKVHSMNAPPLAVAGSGTTSPWQRVAGRENVASGIGLTIRSVVKAASHPTLVLAVNKWDGLESEARRRLPVPSYERLGVL